MPPPAPPFRLLLLSAPCGGSSQLAAATTGLFASACGDVRRAWRDMSRAADPVPVPPRCPGACRCIERVRGHRGAPLTLLLHPNAGAAHRRMLLVDLGANVFATIGSNVHHSQRRFLPPNAPWELGSTAQLTCGYPNGSRFEVWAFEPNAFPALRVVSPPAPAARAAPRRLLAAGLRRRAPKVAPAPALIPYPDSVRVVRGVAGVRGGRVPFYFDKSWWGAQTSSLDPSVVRGGQAGTTESVNFTAWLRLHARPHDWVVVKIDIEGAEHSLLPALRGSGTLRDLVDELFLECHPPFNYGARGDGRISHRCAKVFADLRADGTFVHEWG
eukprot:gene6517-30279_t